MNKTIKEFGQNESGATAIEYALIAAIVGIGIISALSTMKTSLVGTFNTTANDLNTFNQAAE